MTGLGPYRRRLAVVALSALAGCAAPYTASVPTTAPASAPADNTPPPSAQSAALSAYYADLERQMLARGLLMPDDGTPVSARILARNFEAIALYDEYTLTPRGYVRQQTPSRLRRWEKPIRLAIEFGDSVPVETRQTDEPFITAYAARLSAITGHPITVTRQNPNYLVLVVGTDDHRQMDARLQSFAPNLSGQVLAALENMPKTTYCTVFALPEPGRPYTYSKAVAIIRAEHPRILRQSCVHEELAQGLGLANDSPFARPSIFNDNDEFGFLTGQDEMLLKILYDPRLSVGMSVEQARPIVQTIATELAG